jgi:peptidoglycan hydrolase-like protein with peptidoglycan-binding domain
VRRRSALAVGLPAAALAAVAAVVVASAGGPKGAAPAAAARRVGTELVSRRTLVDRARIDGTLGYGGERAAIDRLGGTITWLPSAGSVIRPGRRLFEVDGAPVILMDGSVPAWRGLEVGVSDGVDVRQLERNLAALGYDPGTVDEHFSSATAAAVKSWQKALGLPQTGSVELGRVVFLPGTRRVKTVDATLGSTGGSGGGSPAAWDGVAPRYAYADHADGATTPSPAPTTPTSPSTAPTTPHTTPTTPSTTPTTPRTTPTPSSSGKLSGSNGQPNGDGSHGGGGAAATTVLTTTSTVRVVTAKLDVSDQQLARVGADALVVLPDGQRVRGKVVRVGTDVTNSGSGGGGGGGGGSSDPTLPLTIRLGSPRTIGTLDSAPVAVQLTRTSRRNVLAVPVASLLGQPGGGYAVQIVRATGAVFTVPVQPGLFADGYVELRGGAVRAGDRVEVPR